MTHETRVYAVRRWPCIWRKRWIAEWTYTRRDGSCVAGRTPVLPSIARALTWAGASIDVVRRCERFPVPPPGG